MANLGNDLLQNLQNLDLRNPAHHLYLMQRELTQEQVKAVMKRIKRELSMEWPLQSLTMLNNLRKKLKEKYSIFLSSAIVSNFMKTTSCKMLHRSSLNFMGIDKEIKDSGLQIQKKKYFLDKNISSQPKKPSSVQKRKRRNVLYSTVSIMPVAKPTSTLDVAFVKQKLFILKQYLEQEEMKKMEEALVAKLEAINQKKYGVYTDKIKNYTVYDSILQKIFSLVQEDTKHIEIRQKYRNVYKKMKEEMVGIITNEDQVQQILKKVERISTKPSSQANKQNRQNAKKNYYQLEKDKLDLTAQIEETIDTAKKSIKEALIKRGRPDYAYELELSLDNRRTPFNKSRT